jgi:hypothetical protein
MRGAEADRDDRLADRHDDDEAMALDEVRRRDGEPAFGSPQGREEPFEQPGTGPDTYWAVPPAAPPATTIAAAVRLDDDSRRSARAVIPAARVNRVEWTATTTRYASPNSRPLPEKARGIVRAKAR